MDFNYIIIFHTGAQEIRREGKGLFYPHDGGFNLEHMLWAMTEEFGRPDSVQVTMDFVKYIG